jgi:hypothetical protein
MIIPERPSGHGRSHAPPVSESQPRPTAQGGRWGYCEVRPPTIRCGEEHTAYAGEWLCPRCYRRLFEGPGLFSRNEARHV